MKRWWIGKIVRGIVMVAVATFLLSLVIMMLWNALIPAIFNGPLVSYWQAMGLLILSHILLRGWSPWRHGNGWRHDRWRKRFEEKLAGMAPEEREKFRAEWRKHCGWDPGAHHGTDAGDQTAA